MEQLVLVALAVVAVVGVLHAIGGCIEAGSGWRSWLMEAALPFYGLIAGAIVCLLLIGAVVMWSWRTLFGG